MGGVVVEAAHGRPGRAVAVGPTGAVRVLQHAVPEPEVGAARHRVVLQDVVRVHHPEAARLDVGVQQAGQPSNITSLSLRREKD